MKLRSFSLALLFSLLTAAPTLDAGVTIKNGEICDAETVATMPAEWHYNAGLYALENENWPEAERQFRIVTFSFPNTQIAHESYYYLGIASFNLEELDYSNDSFNEYLKGKQHPKYFIEAMQYKFNIAEKFRNGARRRILGTKQLPKWLTGRTMATGIYDDIIIALPCHELAVRALFSKGLLQWEVGNYRESVEAFRMITKRFPKNELAPESYLMMMAVYLEQSRTEFQNPDILAFAQITLRKFKHDFPREERIECAEEYLLAIKEVYARGLFDTGAFYERVGKPVAAAIYYQNAENLFPETVVAQWCRCHLERLQSCGVEVVGLPCKPAISDSEDDDEDFDNTDKGLENFHLTDLDDEE